MLLERVVQGEEAGVDVVGSGVGRLVGTESSGWQQWPCSLPADLSPADWLLRTAPEKWSSTRVGGKALLPCWGCGGEEVHRMCPAA